MRVGLGGGALAELEGRATLGTQCFADGRARSWGRGSEGELASRRARPEVVILLGSLVLLSTHRESERFKSCGLAPAYGGGAPSIAVWHCATLNAHGISISSCFTLCFHHYTYRTSQEIIAIRN